MALYDDFPYTNFHSLNLDWIVKKLSELENGESTEESSSSTETLARNLTGNYPYTNFHSLNLDWVIRSMLELESDFETLENEWENLNTTRLLSDQVKNAILQCFENVAWINDHGQQYYNTLHDIFFPPVVVSTLTAVIDQGERVFYVGEDINVIKNYLTVTAELSDSTTITVPSTQYVLTGSLSQEGPNIITVTYMNASTTITVNAAAVNLVSISAVHTQSGTVYTTDTLDSLKSDLVVTAHYNDSSTATVPSTDYTLSGTLTTGTSVITVTYEGFTATFNVTVTAWTWMYKASDGQTLSQRTDLFTPGASAGTLTETISDGLLHITATNNGGQKYWAFISPTTNTNAVMEMRIKYAQVVYAAEYANLQIQLSNGTGGAKVGASRDGNYTATPKFATTINTSTTWNPDIVIDDWYVVRIKIEDGKQSVYVNGIAVIENQNLCTSYCTYNRIFMQAPNNQNASPSEVYIDYISYKNYN